MLEERTLPEEDGGGREFLVRWYDGREVRIGVTRALKKEGGHGSKLVGVAAASSWRFGMTAAR